MESGKVVVIWWSAKLSFRLSVHGCSALTTLPRSYVPLLWLTFLLVLEQLTRFMFSSSVPHLFLLTYQQSLSATPRIIPGLNYQLYCPYVQCKNLPKFLTVTVELDCHPPPPVDASLLGIKYLPTRNVFLILKQTVGFHVVRSVGKIFIDPFSLANCRDWLPP